MTTLKSHLLAVGCILVSLSSPAWAQNLPFGQVQTGTIASVAQSNTYTFSANANDVVVFTMTTSGSLVPKILLYNPDGTPNSSNYSGAPFGCSGSTVGMTSKLPATAPPGTYTLLVRDCSDTNTGNYDIYAQRTNNPSGAAPLPFGQVQNGTISSAAQRNSYTFSGNANDIVVFTMVTTSGSLIPIIGLYNPDGTPNSSNYSGAPFGCSGSTVGMTSKLPATPATGTYTLLVWDCSNTNTGNYVIYAQRTNNPSGCANLPFGQVQTGTISSAAQRNCYIFSAKANDVVDFTMVTSGSLIPIIGLYNPNGMLNSSNYSGAPFGCSGSTVEMNNVKLPATAPPGTYTLLVGDCSNKNTGNYNLSSQCIGICPFTAATSTTLASSSNPSILNSFVTFTATVTTSGPTPPTGTVFFEDGTTTLGMGTLDTSGVATFNTSSLALGQHSITAVYGGDANNITSTSTVLTQTILELIVLSPSSAIAGGSAFVLTVYGSNFVNGSSVLWNGSSLTTTFVGSTELQASVPAANIASAGISSVSVSNPSGGTSNSATFTIQEAYSGTSGFLTMFTNAGTLGNSALYQNSGLIGLGTTSPGVAMDVVGNNAGLRLSGTGTHQVTVTSATTGVSGRLGQDANGFFFASDTNSKSVRFLTNNGTLNEWMRITSAGNIGIRTTAPATALQVVGDIRVGTSGSDGCLQNFAGTALAGTCSSDLRLKTGILPFAPVLDRLVKLQPVHFNWKTEEYPEYHFGAARNSGLIAQDVEKVFPELVSADARGFKMVNYTELPYLTLAAIGELKMQNDTAIRELRTENYALRAQLASMQARLARLEKKPSHGTKKKPATTVRGKRAPVSKAAF